MRATSVLPSCIFTHASYSAHAPSMSTWDSEMGGHGPKASSDMTNEKGWPAR